MKKKSNYCSGQLVGKWTLKNKIGSGGNGEIWKCHNDSKDVFAVKFLTKPTNKAYKRFLLETKTIMENSDIEGIIHIVDCSLPVSLGEQVPYYVMPLATGTLKNLYSCSLFQIIDSFIYIAETISKLHAKIISHRDIKPENILEIDGKYILSDFGLVKVPRNTPLSSNNEPIGPHWTIAPEMRRNSTKADGLKADVYSLAKTLWIALTKNEKCFDGQFLKNSVNCLSDYIVEDDRKLYSSALDKLLSECTDSDPNSRPTIDEFINLLNQWKIDVMNFHKGNRNEWVETLRDIFPVAIPSCAVWIDLDDIIDILSKLSKKNGLVHMFMPMEGGVDIDNISEAYEKSFLVINGYIIVKPICLEFENIVKDELYESYFRFQADRVNLIYHDDFYANPYVNDLLYEPLYEFYNTTNNKYEYSKSDDEVNTTSSEFIQRYFSGSFVIVCKRSSYNLTESTYDGRHCDYDSSGFRELVIKTHDNLKKRKINLEDIY